jgi:hypothetical protein
VGRRKGYPLSSDKPRLRVRRGESFGCEPRVEPLRVERLRVERLRAERLLASQPCEISAVSLNDYMGEGIDLASYV